jgi:hypothetical protein
MDDTLRYEVQRPDGFRGISKLRWPVPALTAPGGDEEVDQLAQAM